MTNVQLVSDVDMPIVLSWQREHWGEVGQAIVANSIVTIGVYEGTKILATASLVKRDLPGENKGPWLAGVFVLPEYRGLGMATELVGRIEEIASDMFDEIFLFTDTAQTLYTRLGFKFLKSDFFNKKPITVMRKVLPG